MPFFFADGKDRDGKCPLCGGGFRTTPTAGRYSCLGCGAMLLAPAAPKEALAAPRVVTTQGTVNDAEGLSAQVDATGQTVELDLTLKL